MEFRRVLFRSQQEWQGRISGRWFQTDNRPGKPKKSAPPRKREQGKKKASRGSSFSEDFSRASIPNRENHAYLCVAATVAGCCKRNSSSVSLGTFTCWPRVNTCTPAPAAEPTPAPIAAPLPPPAIAPMIAPATAPPPTFFAVLEPRPLPFKL